MMRRALASPPQLSLLLLRPFSSITTATLTSDELAEINAVIRRLTDANHFKEAIKLLSATLLASSPFPPSSVPFLIDRLSSLPGPDMLPAMSLLTTLRHHNPPPSPAIPFCSNFLISSYLRRRRFREAYKVICWLMRDESPCRPNEETYKAFLRGACESGSHGRAAEAVRVLREMVRDGVVIGEDVRGWVWRCMLTEARVDEARELDSALAAADADADADAVVEGLIDRMMKEWQE